MSNKVPLPYPEWEGPVNLDIGCGPQKKPDCIGLDLVKYPCVDIVADCLHLPFKESCIDEVFARSILEHFTTPYQVLEEMYRVVSPNGNCYIIVPNYGTYSSESDPTHKFVTDLPHWYLIISSFFKDILVEPFGMKFQACSKKWLNKQAELILDGFYDLAQGFKFYCRDKKNPIFYKYVPYFMEDFAHEMKREYATPRETESIPRLNISLSYYSKSNKEVKSDG